MPLCITHNDTQLHNISHYASLLFTQKNQYSLFSTRWLTVTVKHTTQQQMCNTTNNNRIILYFKTTIIA